MNTIMVCVKVCECVCVTQTEYYRISIATHTHSHSSVPIERQHTLNWTKWMKLLLYLPISFEEREKNHRRVARTKQFHCNRQRVKTHHNKTQFSIIRYNRFCFFLFFSSLFCVLCTIVIYTVQNSDELPLDKCCLYENNTQSYSRIHFKHSNSLPCVHTAMSAT